MYLLSVCIWRIKYYYYYYWKNRHFLASVDAVFVNVQAELSMGLYTCLINHRSAKHAPSPIDSLSYDVCLEVRGEIIRLFCAVLCTEVIHSLKHT